MAAVLLFAAALVLSVNALNGSRLQEVLHRIGQLEERDRNQQLELKTLREQNAALVNNVNTMADELRQLKQLQTQQSKRIIILEEQERGLTEKFRLSAEGKPLKSKRELKPSETTDVHDTTANNTSQNPVQNITRNVLIQNITRNVLKASTNIMKYRKPLLKGQNRIREAGQEQSVAFFATLTTHRTVLGNGQPVVFDNVITNNGNAYHQSTGGFTVPFNGVYVFSATIFNVGQSAHYEYNVNGQLISIMFVPAGNEHHTTSQNAILNLKKGDDVTIRNVDAGAATYGYNYSAFSGFLLTTAVGDGVSSIIG